MQHSFDVDLASRYGLTEAILMNHFWYWIEHNMANDVNFYEGKYWTFNSIRAFKEIFPYLSEKKIRTAIKNLLDEGVLVSGNFNKSYYDRTKWYAFSDMAILIFQKSKIDLPYRENQSDQKGKPIPDIIPNINTDINTDIYTSDSAFSEFWSEYPKKIGKAAAEKAFKKVKVSKAVLLDALRKQKQSAQWTKDGGQFIPNPATWLNQCRWEDDLGSLNMGSAGDPFGKNLPNPGKDYGKLESASDGWWDD